MLNLNDESILTSWNQNASAWITGASQFCTLAVLRGTETLGFWLLLIILLHNWDAPWITTIENDEIESRKLVTNKAIVDAVLSYSVNSILDIGCGEGWLTRELTHKGMEAWGVDGVSALIEKAQLINCGKFQVASYEDIVNKNIPPTPLIKGGLFSK